MTAENSSNLHFSDQINSLQCEDNHQCCHNILKYLREHNEVTGIHGLRYLTEKRSRCEKFVWAIIVLISLCGFVYMTLEVIDKYNTSPVVVSFANDDTPIYSIPFPTVTICPEAKYLLSGGFSYSNVYKDILNGKEKNISASNLEKFFHMNLLCNSSNVESNVRRTVDDDFFSTIDKLKINKRIMFMECSYMEKKVSCDDVLKPIIIDQGICYSFNLLDKREIFENHVFHYKSYYEVKNTTNSFNLETGYHPDSDLDAYPRRAITSGASNALRIILLSSKFNQDFLCSSFHQGWRILVHSPYDVPQLSKHYFRVPLDKEVVAAVEPDLIATSEAVKDFSPKQRKCFLLNENPLEHFKIYTQSNCILECLTNFTLMKCGCVSFHMPRHNTTPVCGIGSKLCVNKAEDEVKYKVIYEEFSASKSLSCDCKPSCTELKYYVETSHSDFYYKEFFKFFYPRLESLLTNSLESHYSVISIYLENEQFRSKERRQLYDISDLISNLGGLLGLFTGFSLITLAEVIYFLSLRIFCNVRLYNNWSGPD